MKKKIVLTELRYSMLMDIFEDAIDTQVLKDYGWDEEDVEDFVDNIFHPLYNTEGEGISVKIVIKGYKNPADFTIDEDDYMGDDLCGSNECPDDGDGSSCGSDECPNLTVEKDLMVESNGCCDCNEHSCYDACECGCDDDDLCRCDEIRDQKPDTKDVWNANEAWRA